MRALPVLPALVAVLATAAPAAAASPPTGKYDCVIGADSILFGTLTIKSGKHYVHRGTKGTFTTSGKKIRFRKGDFDGFHGTFLKTTENRWEIDLAKKGDSFTDIYCSHR